METIVDEETRSKLQAVVDQEYVVAELLTELANHPTAEVLENAVAEAQQLLCQIGDAQAVWVHFMPTLGEQIAQTFWGFDRESAFQLVATLGRIQVDTLQSYILHDAGYQKILLEQGSNYSAGADLHAKNLSATQ